jgi:hypothetical protein
MAPAEPLLDQSGEKAADWQASGEIEIQIDPQRFGFPQMEEREAQTDEKN